MRTWLIDLSPAECASHLASEPLGRLGVIVDGRPEIFPINYTYDESSGHIVFATNARTKLAAALNWPWVAFEVDDLTDHVTGDGWSVLVVGHAENLTDADQIARASTGRVATWATGDHVRWVRIVPDKITGKQFTRVD